MNRKKILRYTGLGSLLLLTAFLLFCYWADVHIRHQTSARIYKTVSEIPPNEVGLVLGTSKFSRPGVLNPYFTKRIRAAAELYHAGKVQHLIVSGDNSSKAYNEPRDMKDLLMRQGVPSNAITCDYAGLRTFDSVVRAWKIFGQQKFTIISQEFHNERALYIADGLGLDCIAYSANPVYRGPASKTREFFARGMAVLDVHVLGTTPKYLGEEIKTRTRKEDGNENENENGNGNSEL